MWGGGALPEPCNSTPLAAARLAAYIYIHLAQQTTPVAIAFPSFSRCSSAIVSFKGERLSVANRNKARCPADPSSDGQYTKRSATPIAVVRVAAAAAVYVFRGYSFLRPLPS